MVCVPTVKVLAAAPTGEERRGTAYAGMDLQPSAKDCIRLAWRKGGRERSSQGWVENGVKRKEQALLEDHQTRCLIKADLRKVSSLLNSLTVIQQKTTRSNSVDKLW